MPRDRLAAISQQAKNLDGRIGAQLFRRLPCGSMLTDKSMTLLPVLAKSFGRIAAVSPFADLRLLHNNNRGSITGEGVDYAIRFGDGA